MNDVWGEPEELVPNEEFVGGIGRRVARNYVISVVRLVIGQLIGIVTLVLLSQRLDEGEYGLYAGFSIAILSGYYLFSEPLTTVLARPDRLSVRLVNATMTALVLWMGVVSAAVLAAGTLLGWSPLLIIAVVAYALTVGLAYPPFMMLWRQVRTGQQALLGLVERAVFQLVAVALIVGGVAIEPAIGVALFLAAATFFLMARRMYHWPLRFADPRAALPVVREARHPFSALLAISSVDLFAIPAIALVAGGHEAGVYAWAASILSAPVGFITTAILSLQPAFARMDASAIDEAIERCIRVIGVLAVTLCAAVAVLVPFGIELFLPDRWLAAVVPLWLLLAGATIHGCTNTVVSLLNARGSLAQIASWQVIAYGSGFVAMVGFGAAYGARGAASGYLISRIVLAIPLAREVGRTHGVPMLRRTASLLAAGIGAVAAGVVSAAPLGSGWPALAIASLVAVVTLIVLLAILVGRALLDDLSVTAALVRQRGVQPGQTEEAADGSIP